MKKTAQRRLLNVAFWTVWVLTTTVFTTQVVMVVMAADGFPIALNDTSASAHYARSV